ncbi:hypothetical protein RJ035_005523 [Blastomyces gilchristii]
MAIWYAYMYTLFHQAHTTGSTVMRALAWEFPNDLSLASADRQFLLGPSLMVIPVLKPQATAVDGEIWYDWYAHTPFKAIAVKNSTIDAPLGHIPLYVRGGSVPPMHEPALTTRAARNSPWSLLVVLDRESRAKGQIYIDDGESVKPNSTLLIHLTVEGNSIHAVSNRSYEDTNCLDRLQAHRHAGLRSTTINSLTSLWHIIRHRVSWPLLN